MVVETTINYDLQPLLREASRPSVLSQQCRCRPTGSWLCKFACFMWEGYGGCDSEGGEKEHAPLR